MAIQINGNGTITGISVGGLPNGIVDTDMIAANAVSSGKLATGAGGKILQYKTAKRNTGNTEVTSTSYQEVHSDLRITLTPIASDSIIHVLAYIYCSNNDNKYTTFRMRRNTASDFSGTSTEVLTGSDTAGDDDGVCSVYANEISVLLLLLFMKLLVIQLQELIVLFTEITEALLTSIEEQVVHSTVFLL